MTGAHFGYADTDMPNGFDVPKLDPTHVANTIIDAVARGDEEVIVDDFTRQVKASLSDDITALYATA